MSKDTYFHFGIVGDPDDATTAGECDVAKAIAAQLRANADRIAQAEVAAQAQAEARYDPLDDNDDEVLWDLANTMVGHVRVSLTLTGPEMAVSQLAQIANRIGMTFDYRNDATATRSGVSLGEKK